MNADFASIPPVATTLSVQVALLFRFQNTLHDSQLSGDLYSFVVLMRVEVRVDRSRFKNPLADRAGLGTPGIVIQPAGPGYSHQCVRHGVVACYQLCAVVLVPDVRLIRDGVAKLATDGHVYFDTCSGPDDENRFLIEHSVCPAPATHPQVVLYRNLRGCANNGRGADCGGGWRMGMAAFKRGRRGAATR